MKVGPNGDFQITLRRETHLVREAGTAGARTIRGCIPNQHLYDGIFSATLNHSQTIYLVPSFEMDDVTYDLKQKAPEDVESAAEARAKTAAGRTVITPDASRAGEDCARSIDGSNSQTVVLFVSPAEYDELSAETRSVLDKADEFLGLDDEHIEVEGLLEVRLTDRFDAPTINEVEDFAIAKFIRGRLMNSELVDTHMLRNPVD